MTFPTIPVVSGQKLHLALCDKCSEVRAVAVNPPPNERNFPDTGYWIECPVCETYTMHWRIKPFGARGLFEMIVAKREMSEDEAFRDTSQPMGTREMAEQREKPHLIHEAYVSLLKHAETWDEEDWANAAKSERHAINAALDIRDLKAKLASQRQTPAPQGADK